MALTTRLRPAGAQHNADVPAYAPAPISAIKIFLDEFLYAAASPFLLLRLGDRETNPLGEKARSRLMLPTEVP